MSREPDADPTTPDTPPDWAGLLAAAEHDETPSDSALRYIDSWSSQSKPVKVAGNEDDTYWVLKSHQYALSAKLPRIVINERIVGNLGALIGAPVPEIGLVEVPQALIDIEPKMAHLGAGLSHGSRYVEDTSDRDNDVHDIDAGDNRDRFLRLMLLNAWCGAGDRQFIYMNQPPRLVYSVDHGNFLPGGAKWTETDLRTADPPTVEADRFPGLDPTEEELSMLGAELRGVSDQDVATVVASIPTAWGLSGSEQVQLLSSLAERRDLLHGLPELQDRTEEPE